LAAHTHDDHDHEHTEPPDHGEGRPSRKSKGHAHSHAHDHNNTPARRLAIALAITASFMFVEAAAGWLAGSLALLADAGHMLSDAAALTLALVAQRIAARPRSHDRTFGSRRAEVLAAFVNGIALVVTALLIVREAVGRLWDPVPIAGYWMLVTALAGLGANLISALVLRSGSGHNPNTRAAYLHVLSDALGSVGAILAAVLVMAFSWRRADPIISLFIAALILYGAWRLVRETVSVLMEGTPEHIDVVSIETTIRSVPGICEVHDLHVWTISENFHVLTAHVVLNGSRHGTDVVADASRAIHARHGIEHVTLQPEAPVPGLVQLRIRGKSPRPS
jgi:cobalt-zinc-cadmium efflux system protein